MIDEEEDLRLRAEALAAARNEAAEDVLARAEQVYAFLRGDTVLPDELAVKLAHLEGAGVWWQGVDQVIPSGQWTPVVWPTQWAGAEWGDDLDNLPLTALTSAATLPQSTIQVVSTAGFPAPTTERPAFLMANVNDEFVVVRYTGMTSTSFTGCTLGTGELPPGTFVAAAPVFLEYPEIDPPLPEGAGAGHYLTQTINVLWETRAPAVDEDDQPRPYYDGVRRIRWRNWDGDINLPIYESSDYGHVVDDEEPQAMQLCGEPAGWPPQRDYCEVYQDSGRPILLVHRGIDAPILMMSVHFHPVETPWPEE